MENVFYVPGQPWVIDYAIARADGVIVSQLQGLTLEQIQVEHPGAIITTYFAARAEVEAGCKSEPRCIDEVDFEYGLNVLPPTGWMHDGDSESFKMSEHTNGRITAIYARVGETFWKFQDVYTLTHAEIIEKIHKVQKNSLVTMVS